MLPMVFRTRDLLVRQRTQLINAIRGHLTEFWWVAPKGPSHVSVLASLFEEGEEIGASLPEAARAMFLVTTGQPPFIYPSSGDKRVWTATGRSRI